MCRKTVNQCGIKLLILSVVFLSTLFFTPATSYAAGIFTPTSFLCTYFNVVLTPFGACSDEPVREAELVLPSIPPAPPRTAPTPPTLPARVETNVPTNTTSRIIEQNEYVTYHTNAGITREELDTRINALGTSLRSEYLTQTQALLANTVDRDFFTKQVDRIFESVEDNDGDASTLTSFDNATLDSATLSSSVVISDLSPNALLYVNDDQELTASSQLFIANNNLAIGTTTAYELLTVNSPIFLGSSVPTTTTNRLYNTNGTLYWNGNVLAGASAGQWDSNGTDVYRATGNVGIGSSTPSSRLTVVGNTFLGGNLTTTGTLLIAGLTTLATTTISSSTIENLNLINALSGTSGGTGLSSITQNQLLIGGAGNTWTQLATSSLGITISDTIGTLAVNRGGTGATTLSGLLQGNGTGPITAVTGTAGQIPYFNGTNTLLATSSLFIASNGNIGIGSTTPSANLSVQGDQYISGNLITGGLTTGGGITIGTTSNQLVSFFTQFPNTLVQSIGSMMTASNGGWFLQNGAAGASAPSYSFRNNSNSGIFGSNSEDIIGFAANGTEVGRFSSSGYLGVGSSSPTSLLTVASSTANGTARLFSVATSSELFTVLANGNVGVGTTSPLYRLVVEGDIQADNLRLDNGATILSSGGAMIFNNIAGGDVRLFGTNLYPQNSGVMDLGRSTFQWRNAYFSDNLHIGTTSTLAKLNIQATGTADILNLFETGGEEVFTVLENGNVGIGSSTPSAKLTVLGGSGSEKSLVLTDDTGVERFSFTANGRLTFGTAPMVLSTRLNVSGNEQLVIRPTNFANSASIVLQSSSGSVDSGFSSVVFSGNAGGASETSIVPKAEIRVNSFGVGTPGDFIFNQGTAFDSGGGVTGFRETMRIQATTGNVGIGSSTPGSLLSVAGNITATGTVSFINDLGRGISTVAAGTLNLYRDGGYSTPYIRLGANGSLSGGGFLYSSNGGASFRFGNPDVPWLELSSITSWFNTNIGIGTSTPGAKLVIQSSTSSSPFAIASTTGVNMVEVLANGNLGLGGASTNVKLSAYNSQNSTSSYGMYSQSDAGAYVSSFNYGLSSIANGATATLGGISNYGLYGQAVHDPSGNSKQYGVYGTASNNRSNAGGVAIGGYFEITNNGGFLNSAALVANNNVAVNPIFLAQDNSVTVFTIDDGGNVGIGSSTPGSRLTVIGDTYLGGNLIATGTLAISGTSTLATTTISSLEVSGNINLSTGSYYRIGGVNAFYNNGQYTRMISGSTGFQVENQAGTALHLTVLDSNGNVGIGSSTPSSRLTVIGNTYLGGNLTATGTLSIAGTSTFNGNVAIGTTTPTPNARLTVAGGGISVDQPTNPTLTGTANTSGNAVGVAIVGRYAYVADDSGGLQVIDTSDPTSPTILGNLATGGGASNVTVVGRYAYVSTGSDMEIIDISNPTKPTSVSTFGLLGFGRDVTVIGRYAYVAADSAGLQIIDISNPTSPTLASTLSTGGQAYGITLAGRYAYVADSSLGLQIIDISNPSSPTLVDTLVTTDARAVSVNGSYAYVADSASGLRIINIASSTNPTLTSTFNTAGNAVNVVVFGRYAYVADYASGLQIIDTSNPSSPILTSTFDTTGTASDVSIVGRYAYVADTSSGLQIINVNGSNFSSLFAGALGATEGNFEQNLVVGNNGSFSGGLDVGHDARVGGGLTITGTASSSLLDSTTNTSLLVSTGNIGVINGGLRFGTTTSIPTAASVVPRLQVSGTNASNASVGLFAYSAGTAPIYALNRSRGANIGENGIVQNNDTFGNIYFAGDDGTSFRAGAIIQGEVDGTPGVADMPGRIVFNTTADGAGSPAERMRISSNGNIGIGTTSSSSRLTVDGTSRFTSTALFDTWLEIGTSSSPIVSRSTGDIVAGTSDATLNFDGSAGALYLQSSGAGSNGTLRIGRRSRGTISAPTSVVTGDNLMSVRGYGYNASTSPSFDEAARIDFDSEGTIGEFVPGALKFLTNSGAGSLTERMVIDSEGLVKIRTVGTSTSPLQLLSSRRAIVSNDLLGGMDLVSTDTNLGTAGSTTARIAAFASQTHTVSALGTRLEFFVTADSTVTPVSALTINQNSRVGIGTTSPVSLLSVSGTLTVTATSSMAAIGSSVLLGGATTLSTDANGQIIRTPSDERLKTNVSTIENALDTVLELRGVRYDWVDTNRFGDQSEVGFLAQEVDLVLPEVVRKGGEYWSLNTPNILAVVVEAIKEIWADVTTIKSDVSNLKEENERLKNRLEALESSQSASVPQSNTAPTPTPPPTINDTPNPSEPSDSPVNESVPTTPEEPAQPTELAPVAETPPAPSEPPAPETQG